MEFIKSFNSYIEDSIKDNWYKDALTDYLGTTLRLLRDMYAQNAYHELTKGGRKSEH